jgi:hypothetical protein
MYFSAAASSENDHGSMNLALNTASPPSTRPSKVAPIQRSHTAGARALAWIRVSFRFQIVMNLLTAAGEMAASALCPR